MKKLVIAATAVMLTACTTATPEPAPQTVTVVAEPTTTQFTGGMEYLDQNGITMSESVYKVVSAIVCRGFDTGTTEKDMVYTVQQHLGEGELTVTQASVIVAAARRYECPDSGITQTTPIASPTSVDDIGVNTLASYGVTVDPATYRTVSSQACTDLDAGATQEEIISTIQNSTGLGEWEATKILHMALVQKCPHHVETLY